MLEIISISTLDIQREVIVCIPEVLDDSQHSDVAKQLRYGPKYTEITPAWQILVLLMSITEWFLIQGI